MQSIAIRAPLLRSIVVLGVVALLTAAAFSVARAQDTSAPGPVQNLKAAPQAGAILLTWDAPAEGTVTHYAIGRLINGEPVELVAASVTENSYIDRDVSVANEYVYQVLAFSDATPGSSTETAPVRPLPADVEPTISGNDNVRNFRENSTDPVGEYRVVDAATDRELAGYAITKTDWADGALFNVASGELSFITPPDFENPQNSVGRANVYRVQLVIKVGDEEFDAMRVRVTVTDDSDEPLSHSLCDRTRQVRDAILAQFPDLECSEIRQEHTRRVRGLDFNILNGYGVIHQLRRDDFSELRNLQTLRFRNNRLTELPEGIFDGLDRLSRLDLSGNQIASLPIDRFTGVDKLTELNLSGNPGAPFEVLPPRVESRREPLQGDGWVLPGHTGGNNLIDVSTLAQLNAIRYDLDGDGQPAEADADRYADAFPYARLNPTLGCPEDGCAGYELVADLDFDANGNGQRDDRYRQRGGWQPIGERDAPYNATFNGNRHTIANLYINASRADGGAGQRAAGLFGVVGSDGAISGLGLVDATVLNGLVDSGALVGENGGAITRSYSTGRVRGGERAGGLVGYNNATGTIRASYSTADVSATNKLGGLAGRNGGQIAASYAAGDVSANTDNAGGLVGVNDPGGRIIAAYATGQVNAQSRSGSLVGSNEQNARIAYSYARSPLIVFFRGASSAAGGLAAVSPGAIDDSYYDRDLTGQTRSYIHERQDHGKTAADLQSPTGYNGIYANWNVDIDGDDAADAPWHFGSDRQYPALQVDWDGDGMVSADEWRQFGVQVRSPLLTLRLSGLPADGSFQLDWSALDAGGDAEAVSYIIYRVESRRNVTALPDAAGTTALRYTDAAPPHDTAAYEVVALVNGSEVVRSPRVDAYIDYLGDNSLIDVHTLDQLNAMRHDMNGDGTVSRASRNGAYGAAFPFAPDNMGCPEDGCDGYELMVDLDFDENGNGRRDDRYNQGNGWSPIGNRHTSAFTATFAGNGHTISNLYIHRRPARNAARQHLFDTGLFGQLKNGAVISELGLIDVNVNGVSGVGALAGSARSGSKIFASFSTGRVEGNGLYQSPTPGYAGGLIGRNAGRIEASYSTARVIGYWGAGGLTGRNDYNSRTEPNGEIHSSYSVGRVTASYDHAEGGLAGGNNSGYQGSVTNSYFDRDTSGQSKRAAYARTTAELQSPSGYTGIYATWDDHDIDGDGNADAPWDFGTSSQYPILNVFGPEAQGR